MTPSMLFRTLVTAALLIWASGASAGIIEVDQNTSTGFAVSNSDMLQGLTPTVSDPNLIRAEEGQTTNDPAALANGAFGAPGLPGGANVNEVVAIHNGLVLTYTLNTTSHPLGYDLTQINTYTGWRDPGRDAQNYSLYYSKVNSPNTFVLLKPVSYNPGGAPSPSDTAVLLSDSLGGAMVTNVAAVRFSFPSTENGYVGYRELDVVGTPSLVTPTLTTIFSDSFSTSTLDPTKWQVLKYGLESPVHSGGTIQPGTEVADTTTNPGRLSLGGTGDNPDTYWSGMSARSSLAFDATEKTIITVDRVSLSGSGSAYRSSLWLWADDSHYLHFSQNIGEGGWTWNAEDAGGIGTLSPTGSGNNISIFDYLDTDLGSHEMRVVWTPLGPPGAGEIDVFLDGVQGVIHNVSNFPSTFFVMMSGMPRTDGDTVLATFDNLDVSLEVTALIPEPSTLTLLALGGLALVRRRARTAGQTR